MNSNQCHNMITRNKSIVQPTAKPNRIQNLLLSCS